MWKTKDVEGKSLPKGDVFLHGLVEGDIKHMSHEIIPGTAVTGGDWIKARKDIRKDNKIIRACKYAHFEKNFSTIQKKSFN